MGVTVTSVINDACLRYRDLTRAQALLDAQAIHDELTESFRLTADAQDIPLVSGQDKYALDTTVVKVWLAELRTDNVTAQSLEQISQRVIDQRYSAWGQDSVAGHTALQQGTPSQIYRDATSAGGRMMGLSPIPATTSLIVSSVTAATPIAVGFTGAHGLVTGNSLFLTGITGIPAANGSFATITKVDATHVTLDGTVGAGAYTGGGIGATPTMPFVRLHVTRRQVLSEGGSVQTLPEYIFDAQAYVSGIWLRHARRRHKDDLQEHLATFQQEHAKLSRRVTGLLIDVHPQAHPNFMRRTGRASGRR